jgi:hypothetical protein
MPTLYTGTADILSDVLGSNRKLQLQTIPLTNNQVDVGSTHVTRPSLVICFRNILCMAFVTDQIGSYPLASRARWPRSKDGAEANVGERRSMAEV